MQRCVDENNRVVDPAYCKTIPQGTSQTTVGPSGGYHVYRYYYGGGGSYSPGSAVYGGGYFPASGHSYSTTNGHSSFTTSTGTSRGGFGSHFSTSGGHGSVGS